MKHRIAEGGRVKIIDEKHQYSGKIGIVTKIENRRLEILNNPKEPKMIIRVFVRLECFDQELEFSNHPKNLDEQIEQI